MVNTGIVLDTVGKKKTFLSSTITFLTASSFHSHCWCLLVQRDTEHYHISAADTALPLFKGKARVLYFQYQQSAAAMWCTVFCTEMRGTMHASLQSFGFVLFDSP